MATSKQSFEKLAKAPTNNPPPRWPDFPIPPEVTKRFPGWDEQIRKWNDQTREFFRQQQESQ